MLSFFDKLVLLKSKANNSYWSARIAAQIGYAMKLSAANDSKFDDQIKPIVDFLVGEIEKNGTITNEIAKEAEKKLTFMSELAKKIEIIHVSHAHIDMNWMWGYQETAATTVDTFRTVLDLMNEYPDFTYSQSQASVYKIIEENDPYMLEEIKQRVKEGKWEISASTWVETDKNMPNGESLARHILYTKRYLSKLLDICPDSMKLDFEPDTFGHNWTVPEIMNKGGVKYYYHCRAYEGEFLYKWQARSGAQVLVYREPKWYNAEIDYDMFFDVPAYCKRYNVDVMMKVYGIGNHGGGPTRRDIERIADMMTWPVMPKMKFGTYHEYFAKLEKFAEILPVVNQELNFVFTGCYTSQSRIKMSNRLSEDKLYEAEAYCAAASVIGDKNYSINFSKAWENVLFNHFHDILPGSGVIDTREYALAQFQKTMAIANTNTTGALKAISSQIDTSGIDIEVDKNSNAEGAGVGYAVEYGQGYKFPQTERGSGKVRVFHMFNPTEFERIAPVELIIWDWGYDVSQLSIKDADGVPAEWKYVQGHTGYWGHVYFKIAVMAKIPALGYATYTVTEEPRGTLSLGWHDDERNDHISDDDIVMENEKVKAVFCAKTMQLISFIDKTSNKDVVSKDNPAGILRYIQEDDVHGMTAWRVGQYMKIENLNKEYNVRVYEKNFWGIRKWVRYEIKFKNSKLNVTIFLDNNSSTLKFNIIADWHEVGRHGEGVPQLNFYSPITTSATKYRYDIPFGTIERNGMNHDMPGNSYAVAIPDDNKGKAVMVVTDTKYGFRTIDNSLAVDLIRSSYDPDPYPEYGVHHINIGLSIPSDLQNQTLAKIRAEFVHPIPFISGTKHTGTLPLKAQLFELSGDVILSAVKSAEDSCCGKKIIIRVYDANGKGANACIKFNKNISKACIADINETAISELNIKDNAICFDVPAYEVITIAVDF